jgi:hypothetical protein
MFKIVRTIRRELIDQNKIGKYLKYAIGEIILVVIGILIALSINTWNENRKQNNAELEFINGIKTDLIQDKVFMNKIIRLAEEKDSIYTILSTDITVLYTNDREKLDALLQTYFDLHGTFYPISGSFQAAISGNEISKYKNKNFTAAVTKLYNSTYERLMDNAKSSDDKWHYLTRQHSNLRRTGHIRNMNQEELTALTDDMFYYMFSMNYYRGNLHEAMREIDRLLAEY